MINKRNNNKQQTYNIYLQLLNRDMFDQYFALTAAVEFTCFCLLAENDMNRIFVYAKTKAQISFAVFAKWIVQFLYFLNPEFPASSHLLFVQLSLCRTWLETWKTGFLASQPLS